MMRLASLALAGLVLFASVQLSSGVGPFQVETAPTFVGKDGETLLKVTLPGPLQRYETVTINSPARLIVDIWGRLELKEAKSFPSSSSLIRGIRLSPFKDRVRLMLDLAQGPVPSFKVSPSETGLIIAFGATGPRALVLASASPAEGKPAHNPSPAAQDQRAQAYTGTPITLDLRDADVRNVFRLLADVSKLNIILGEDVKGKVTVKMVNVPWDQALDTVLKLYSLGAERIDNTLRIATLDTLKKEEEARRKEAAEAGAQRLAQEKKEREETRREALEAKRAALELEELVIEVVPVSYSDAREVARLLEKLKSPRPGAAITAFPKTNSILVKDGKAAVEQMKARIKELDQPTRQVHIEARIVEADTDFTRDLGVQWAGQVGNRSGTFILRGGQGLQTFPFAQEPSGTQLPTMPPGATSLITSGNNLAVNLPALLAPPGPGSALGMTFGRIRDVFQLDLRISALEQDHKARLLSSPKVLTLDGAKALIRQGAKIPYQVQTSSGPSTIFLEADLSLTVTPHITPEKDVLMKVELTRDAPTVVPGAAQTALDKNRAATELLIKDGETIVIGGILLSSEADAIAAVPGVSKIPILGWLFKKKTDTTQGRELLLFITARVVELERPGPPA